MPIAPVAETFVNCVNSKFTFSGTDYSGLVIDGGFDHEVGTDDMTTGGFLSDVATNAGATISVTVGWPQSGALAVTGTPTITEGLIYATVIDHPTGPYFSGNVRYTKSSNPVFSRKSGMKSSYSGKSVGAFTRTNPTPGS